MRSALILLSLASLRRSGAEALKSCFVLLATPMIGA